MRRRKRTGGETMPIYKRCSRCRKRMQAGASCSCIKIRHREYDRFSRNQKAKAFYVSSEWERTRKTVLEMDEGIDVYLYMTEGELVLADTVHHIIPLMDDWEMRCEIENLMSLNHDTHSMIEQLYKEKKTETEQKLKEILRLYRNKQG